MWNLKFISKRDLKENIKNTIKTYEKNLDGIDLKRFNSNIVDPIKMIFDSKVYRKSFEEVINDELARQRDKANNNSIGYFHQNMFKYIKNCEVPKEGFDVIFTKKDGKRIYVEMKNKHNTMNKGDKVELYLRMLNKITTETNAECYLVEAVAKNSQNIIWELTVNKEKMKKEKIRRVSIDKFYEIVTGDKEAFYKICIVLPELIDEIIDENKELQVGTDTVIDELREKNPDILKSLYLLAFEKYEGFINLN